jgi:hypothetical protein
MSTWRCRPDHSQRGLGVDLKNVFSANAWFEVLQTAERSQTAIMTLKPRDATGEKAEAHRRATKYC